MKIQITEKQDLCLDSPKPMTTIEEIHSTGLLQQDNKGLLIQGNNLYAMNSLLERYQGKIKLIYIDPPYMTGLDFKTKDGSFAYSDKFTLSEYLQFIYDRLILMRELLSEDGSIYVHVDYRTSAYIRLLMDEVFGAENFRNEIIWAYNSGGIPKRDFARKHDTIFRYVKSSTYTFNPMNIGIPRGSSKKNNMKKNVDVDGRVFTSIKSNGKIYKYYEDDMIVPSDVWNDISHLQQKDPQRLDYPTQKPEALLERIIKASSNEGDLVSDFFCGSGTTIAVAQKLNRSWIGVDIGEEAICTIKSRLIALDAAFTIKKI